MIEPDARDGPQSHMERALALAEQARALCPPNPAVGCVLVDRRGHIIGEGQTQATGQAHAEVMALRDAARRGHDPAGSTAYVTLEPCSHQGRTGPCTEALIAAGVRKVVVAATDPNPAVAGQGLARLQAAGIEVQRAAGEDRMRALNAGFFSRMERGLPWVRLKAAASLDGRTALHNGVSQWITGPEARADGHAWRARACAVLSGLGTILHDDPRLNVRLPGAVRQPMLVVVDKRLDLPLDAALWDVPQRRLRIYAAAPEPQRVAALRQRGAEVVLLPDAGSDRVDLLAMLRDLAAQEVNELHVEAGAGLNGALWRAGLVDELLLYLAPMLLGPGAGLAELPGLEGLDGVQRLDVLDVLTVGADVRIRARRPAAPGT